MRLIKSEMNLSLDDNDDNDENLQEDMSLFRDFCAFRGMKQRCFQEDDGNSQFDANSDDVDGHGSQEPSPPPVTKPKPKTGNDGYIESMDDDEREVMRALKIPVGNKGPASGKDLLSPHKKGITPEAGEDLNSEVAEVVNGVADDTSPGLI